MKTQHIFVLLLISLLFTACSGDSSISSQIKQTDNEVKQTNSETAQNNKISPVVKATELPVKPTIAGDCQSERKQTNVREVNSAELLPNDKSAAGLDQMINNLAGDFMLDESRNSIFEGDFNGDGCRDIALIVVASDAVDKIKTINDAASNTNIAVIKQNLRTKAKLLPQTRRDNGAVFPPAMKSQNSCALIIIIGGKSGWNWKHGIEGKIFLLLDSVFTVKDCPDCHTDSVPRNSQKQGYDCFPRNSKGDGLFTGGEEAGKLIYFDGKSFAWTQCGD